MSNGYLFHWESEIPFRPELASPEKFDFAMLTPRQTGRSTRSALARLRTGFSTSCRASTPLARRPVLTSSATACR